MNNITNQFLDPPYYHRQIENDLPVKKDGQENLVQRVYATAVPLLMLYKPIAKPISFGMGGLRLVTHVSGCAQAIQKREGWKLAAEGGHAGLAALSVASIFIQFRLGVFITTAADILQNLISIYQHYQEQKYHLLIEDLLQLTASGFYIAILVYASTHILLASIAMQVLLNIYQARKEWNASKTPEALSKLIVACFRLHEGKQTWDRIPKKEESDSLLKDQTTNAQSSHEKESLLEQRSITTDRKEVVSPIEVRKEEKQRTILPRVLQPLAKDITPDKPVETLQRPPSQNLKRKTDGSFGLSQMMKFLPQRTLQTIINHSKGEAIRTVAQIGLIALNRGTKFSDPRLQLMMNALNNRRITRALHAFPVQNFQNVNEQAVLLEDAEGNLHNFGAHYHGFGKALVKGANLCFREKIVDGQEMIELDFKINHAHRERVQKFISLLSDKETNLQMQLISNLTGSSIRDITVEKDKFEIGGFQAKNTYKITFDGIGSILIGGHPKIVGMYNRVVVQIPKNCTLFQLNKMLSLVGLEDTLRQFTPMDLERLKTGYLFRHFFPVQATLFERTPDFFKQPISQLKTTIIEQFPPMKEHFEKYMPKFKPYEILPGRIRYGIEGIGRECYELGARSLISSVKINSPDPKDNVNRILSILKMGMLSSELRIGNGFNSSGLSPDKDLKVGGADSVFTQMVTANDYQNNETPSLAKFAYFNPKNRVALEFDLDVLDTLTYQYHTDEYGIRSLVHPYSTYLERPNVYDFVIEESAKYYDYEDDEHEMMVRERIPPSFIKSIFIGNSEFREYFYQSIKESGLMQINQEGVETILGIPVSQFIRTPSDAYRRERDDLYVS